LGGLVEAGRDTRRFVQLALEHGKLCANDPILPLPSGKICRDRRHILLEIAWDRKVQDPRAAGTSVLEIMRHSTWRQYEGAFGGIHPAITN